MPEQQNPPSAENNPPAQSPLPIGELDRAAVMIGTIDSVQIALAKAQCAKQGKVEWNQNIHCAALARLIACVFEVGRDDARVVRLYTILKENGLGANCSQHQKWLASDSAKVLPPIEKKAQATADSLLA